MQKPTARLKNAAESKKETNIESINSVLTQDYFETLIQDVQNQAEKTELVKWKKYATQVNDIWTSEGKPCLPRAWYRTAAEIAHKDHDGQNKMVNSIRGVWHCPGDTAVSGRCLP